MFKKTKKLRLLNKNLHFLKTRVFYITARIVLFSKVGMFINYFFEVPHRGFGWHLVLQSSPPQSPTHLTYSIS